MINLKINYMVSIQKTTQPENPTRDFSSWQAYVHETVLANSCGDIALPQEQRMSREKRFKVIQLLSNKLKSNATKIQQS